MEFLCDSQFIVFPASHEAKKKRVFFYVEDELVFDLVIALDNDAPDYKFPVNVERFIGKKLLITCEQIVDIQFEQTNTPQLDYAGKYRPQIHFTAKRGWINDPNGLLFYGGKYYMFFQHNPAATVWENMHWGLATSYDLLHWTELGDVLYPDENGTIFSGSGIVDTKNSSGLKSGEDDPLLFFYTSAGNTSVTSEGKKITQRLAISLDGGKTFHKYPKVILDHVVGENRDPKIVRYEPDQSYIMALFLDQHEFALYKSSNLLDWKELQRIEMSEDAECPDFYELSIGGMENQKKWIFSAASDRYYIGTFDGERYVPETTLQQLNYGDISYAAQSWSDEPNHRRIRTAFQSRVIPGQPFGCCMDIPQEMSIRSVNGKMKLCANPIDEIEKLYRNTKLYECFIINKENAFSHKVSGKACDVFMQIRDNSDFNISLYGMSINYVKEKQGIVCNEKVAPVEGKGGVITLRIIYDTISVEIFADEGSVYMGMAYIQDSMLNSLEINSEESEIKIINIREMECIYSET